MLNSECVLVSEVCLITVCPVCQAYIVCVVRIQKILRAALLNFVDYDILHTKKHTWIRRSGISNLWYCSCSWGTVSYSFAWIARCTINTDAKIKSLNKRNNKLFTCGNCTLHSLAHSLFLWYVTEWSGNSKLGRVQVMGQAWLDCILPNFTTS